jgi:hypothetical protein
MAPSSFVCGKVTLSGITSMSARENYRQRAASCHLAAEDLTDPADRVPILELVDTFLRIADRLESLKQVTVLAGSLDGDSSRAGEL